MVNFIIFSLAVIGMTHIVVDGAILQWFRDLIDAYFPKSVSKLIHCNQCTGFWCGLICGYLCFCYWAHILLAGFAGSFLANFAAFVMNYIETQTMINLDDLEEKK